jgi:hypothetical protein
MLALIAPRAFVSPKYLIDKDVKMLNSVKKGLIAAGVIVVASAQNASAALTASDVSMSSATGDMAIVFVAILGVLVIGFGYRMIKKQIG